MRGKAKRGIGLFITALTLTLGFSGYVLASCPASAQTCSPTYQLNQAFFGSGGALNDCSTGSYCAKEAAGELAIGNEKGTADQIQAGFNVDRNPYLQAIVNSTSINVGVLSSSTPKTATATFSVKDYLSSGYQVLTESAAPTTSGHTLHNLSSATTSSPGTEQFGINLTANNSCGGGLPSSLGSAPSQNPSGTFSFGAAYTGYNTACQFKYNNGDEIADSSESSGETDYTISYMFNISNVTPDGLYQMNQVLVVTGTY